MAGRGAYSALSLDRRAEELETPAEFVMDSAHQGTEPQENSYLEVMPGNVWVLALKQGERRTDATILRLQERSGVATSASLKSALLGLDHSIDLAPWEIKTLLIKSQKGRRAEVQEVSLLET